MDNRRNVFFYYRSSAELNAKVESLTSLAENYGFTTVNHAEDANIIVSIGGDGTFLQAVRKTKFRDDCLYVGISTKGSPSVYCDFVLDDTEKIIEAITMEQIEVRKYPVIDVNVDGVSSFKCLNECTIRSGIIKTFVIDVHIDDIHFETFRGDGMIVSTPTGSTAYSKSVNGAVIDPLLPCFQVSELASLNNNRYRTLGSSFVLSGNRRLRLEVSGDGNDYPVIGMDNEALSIRSVNEISITLSSSIIKTVKLKDNSFWEKVKRSFL
ncbi:NAD kinase [Bacillus mangrovi]|uniref:NAD kinase n=2 Tax=Metabacillus mangrovi TaxID=1491830 RepID=A0A7X2S4V5_9BACI|nr:NAD kinase [Metabacillus mangrovi]MTH52836.1 NAD kinase [Metabacillus mangrovi]